MDFTQLAEVVMGSIRMFLGVVLVTYGKTWRRLDCGVELRAISPWSDDMISCCGW